METAQDKPRVREYMTRDVVTVSPTDTVGKVMEKIMESEGHSGFPVTDNGKVRGFITANDLLGLDESLPIKEVMSRNLIVAEPDMKVTDAARVILRSGLQKLPVVDEEGNLLGIISNSDVIRSQIERVTPGKVWKLMRTLESIHNINTEEERGQVIIEDLTPTQDKIYADELDGRTYELKRGLAEPLIVIDKGDKKLLVDGHHRVKAAKRVGIERMDAYIIKVDSDVELGMEKTAENSDLESMDDVEIVDYARHPLIEATRFQTEEN